MRPDDVHSLHNQLNHLSGLIVFRKQYLLFGRKNKQVGCFYLYYFDEKTL